MKWMMRWARWVMVAFLMAGSTWAISGVEGEYVLGPGDQIRISVYQSQDLTLEARISENGTVSFPLIGLTKIGGLPISDAEAKIAKSLRDGNYLKQPQVSILVLQFKASSVSVLGQVTRPGRYALSPLESKLSQVLAQAGGIVAGAGSDTVVITGTRAGKPFRREIDFPHIFAAQGGQDDLTLENGDSIWIDRAPQIYIYGEVQRPGAQILLRDTTLLQALATGGGLTQRGTERGIRVHRRDPVSGQVKILQPGMNDKLEPNDVIYVKESLF